MRFLVTELQETVVCCGDEPDTDDFVEMSVAAIHMCETTQDVAGAIRLCDQNHNDWNVFELILGKAVRRSVISHLDGRMLYDVTIT